MLILYFHAAYSILIVLKGVPYEKDCGFIAYDFQTIVSVLTVEIYFWVLHN